MVPLNAKIQHLAPNVHLGTIIAGSNFIQNIFMVSFLLLTTVFAYFGTNSQSLFYIMGFVALYMGVMVFRKYLVMTFWSVMELFSMLRHTYRYIGLENIPQDKAVLLLGNHVSWLDWIILQLPMKRQINFMMDKDIYHWRGFHSVFKKGEAIPVSPKASKDALKEAKKRLKNGKIVAIYPEGEISQNGELGKFHRGYELILQDCDVVIIPFFIDGLFGSLFAKYKNATKRSFFKRRDVKVYFGKPISKETKAHQLKEIIQKMKDKYETK
jgi:acyl-[acyl-carrier-protein]-phospholipid O-acyltransferase/long-chain-fatty-acid--[acyl-carrier-protein] ligase